MRTDIEKLLGMFSDMEQFLTQDDLSKLIAKHSDHELAEDELDLVSAAASADFSRFRERIDKDLKK